MVGILISYATKYKGIYMYVTIKGIYYVYQVLQTEHYLAYIWI